MRALGQMIMAMLCSFSRMFSIKFRSASIPGDTSTIPCSGGDTVLHVNNIHLSGVNECVACQPSASSSH